MITAVHERRPARVPADLAAASAFPRRRRPPWRVGLAAAGITPPIGVWMSGYAARKEPAQGIAQPLHAKAAAADAAGRPP
jgi:hypothetical protein